MPCGFEHSPLHVVPRTVPIATGHVYMYDVLELANDLLAWYIIYRLATS